MEEKTKLALLNKVGEVEIIYKRKASGKISERPQISTSQDAYEILRHFWNEGKLELIEQFKVLLLNRANRVLYLFEVSTGGIAGTVADPRIVVTAALQTAACSLVLAHNHPSGSLRPSKADEELTRKMTGACSFFDIKVLDHLIVTRDSYFSFADKGLI